MGNKDYHIICESDTTVTQHGHDYEILQHQDKSTCF